MGLGLLLAGALLAVCPSAFALDPALDVSQYAHTAWKVRDGFSKGSISAITQTPDGYLLLGTEFGLLRFDGVKAVAWDPPGGQLPSNRILSLLTARDGTIWIGTENGLASWKDGKLIRYPGSREQLAIPKLLEDREGTLWITAGTAPHPGKLCAIRDGSIQCYGDDGTFGYGPVSLFQDSKGDLWVGTREGLWRWKPGRPKFFSFPGEADGIRAVAEDTDGALLFGWKGRLWRFMDGKTDAYSPLRSFQPFRPSNLFRDRDGSLWIATYDRGLLHVHQSRADVFAQPDGLSGNGTTSFFADREGDIWVGTYDGLDRFREFAVSTFGAKEGLPASFVGSVLADRDGSVWLGAGSLYRWKNGEISTYNKRDGKINGTFPMSLFQDADGKVWVSTHDKPGGVGYLENERFILSGIRAKTIFSFAEDQRGNLWMADQDAGLFRLSAQNEIHQIPWQNLGHKDSSYALAVDPLQDGLWMGFKDGGVVYFEDGQVKNTYTMADGLGGGRVADLRFGSRGTLWAATEGGLSRIRDGRVMTLTSKNGLPCDTVHWSKEDDNHFVWLYMPCGLVRIARSELDAWVAAVAKDKNAKPTIQTTVFDISDGVRSRAAAGAYSPFATKSTDGKLWFAGYDGVAVVDPRHLPFNNLPPPVHVEQITADHKTYDVTSAAAGRLGLPPSSRDLEIDYTALSLVAPEKVHFRYKLEGWDSDWQWVGNRRQAFYTNLSPGDYRFRVAASNNSGVWNEAGTSLDFSIAPAYYQTTWFRLSCVAAFLAMLWGLYQLRLRQVAREFSMRMEERVNERMRIARELHDTMLQSFQGAVLHFQVVSALISKRPQEAQQKLDSALDLADHAIAEGRDAVQGLRSSTTVTNDIATAMVTLGKELAATETNHDCPEFRVDVVGATRDLHPITRDEVCRIAGEALRNAFKHAQASRIEVEIQYDPRRLRLRIRDNGRGIEPHAAGDQDRPGHYGLPGMRERAKLIGGNLELWTKVQAGTEIELVIPAAAAYAKSAGDQRARFFKKGAGAD